MFNIFVLFIVLITILLDSVCQERIYFPDEIREVKSPFMPVDFTCGAAFLPGIQTFASIKIKNKYENYQLYHLNETSEELASKGFQIIVNEVIRGDILSNFSYSNGTFEGNLAFESISLVGFAIGGRNAPLQRSRYMAQIGEKHGNIITWLCDGVLINKRWILSAAHCFAKPGVNPNVIRLGDYNLLNPVDPFLLNKKKFIRDYPIHQLVVHPEFKISERYHDLVLLQIPRDIPQNAYNFIPICLPWDSQANKNLLGSDVALTGWGATQYGGSKTSILQEVILKVFDTSVCATAYSNLPNINQRYPKGITSDRILCVGWEDDGKDACNGDSGAPIVYEYDNSYFLAGIVSGGFGCGLKDYPGLYIPINNPKYLQWIKDVAFT